MNVRLLLETRKGGVTVPASVVQRGPEGPFAYVIAEDGTNLVAKVRPLKVAQIEQNQALIDDGLSPGERVVVDGQYKLQAGAKLKLPDAGGKREGGSRMKAEADGKKGKGGASKAQARPGGQGQGSKANAAAM